MRPSSPESATIAAIATPPAAGAVGILRLSGRHAVELALRIATRVPRSPEPRRAYLSELRDAQGQVVDQGLFLFFRAPRSYTGEDVVELQTHGSPRLLSLLLAEIVGDGRARLAAPGEFTKRASLNGRLDLVSAEAVADLVAAGSEAALRAAASQVQGALSDRIRHVRQQLLEAHAELEGALSFPDEADGAEHAAVARLRSCEQELTDLAASAERGMLMRRGARVVLYGPVNAGKSTLFNALVGEERALVDDEAGTTRDVVEAQLEVDGHSVTLVDTAGFRVNPGRVEAAGIERTRAALRGADLALHVSAVGDSGGSPHFAGEASGPPVIHVRSKSDLGGEALGSGALAVSALRGIGIDALWSTIRRTLWADGVASAVAVTSERHRDALVRAGEALRRAMVASVSSTLEVVAGEIGLAVEALGEITGENASEELLDAIFRRFCIGK